MNTYMIRALVVLILAINNLPITAGGLDPVDEKARQIIDRVIANRPKNDISFNARLRLSPDKWEQVKILVKAEADQTLTIYRTESTSLLVTQSGEKGVKLYLKGVGELTNENRAQPFDQSQFHYYDLATTFLYWVNPRFSGTERIRGRDCYLIENTAIGEPYARVKMWIDQEYFALLRTEAWDKQGRLIKRFGVTSFKKIGEIWIPKTIEIVADLEGQGLNKQKKSRLDIYEGEYDIILPIAWFDPVNFLEVPK